MSVNASAVRPDERALRPSDTRDGRSLVRLVGEL